MSLPDGRPGVSTNLKLSRESFYWGKLMRSLFVMLLAAALFAFGSNSSIAQTVHAVVVADTLDQAIGRGVAENETNIASFLDNVKTLTGLNLSSTVVDGANFS